MITPELKNLDVEYDKIIFIDCLPEDEYNEWEISQEIMKYLADNGVVQMVSVCRTKKLVIATLHYLLKIAKGGVKFGLHVVSHGDKEGLWIKSTNETVFWQEFTNLLEEINNAMGGTLIINMTSCLGLHGIKIVNEHSPHYPFFGLVGYSEDLEVNKGKEMNRMFYRKIIEDKEVQQAVAEIRGELLDDKLYCLSSQGFKIIRNTLSKHK